MFVTQQNSARKEIFRQRVTRIMTYFDPIRDEVIQRDSDASIRLQVYTQLNACLKT